VWQKPVKDLFYFSFSRAKTPLDELMMRLALPQLYPPMAEPVVSFYIGKKPFNIGKGTEGLKLLGDLEGRHEWLSCGSYCDYHFYFYYYYYYYYFVLLTCFCFIEKLLLWSENGVYI